MEDIKGLIKQTVNETIRELRRQNLISKDMAAYDDINELLTEHYRNGEKDAALSYAIYGKRFDPYYRIIPMYYGEGRTLDDIRDVLGVDLSTVVRNKKRLCLEIYQEVI